MANPVEAVLRSVLAPCRHDLLPAAAPFVSERRLKLSRRKPTCVSFACSAEHVARHRFVGTQAISSCSERVKERSAGADTSPTNMEREARIRKHLKLENPEYLPSPYDTAVVAMVPSPGCDHQTPRFPQCLEWILRNQHDNGSWGFSEFDLSINKETVMSTLACVIALKKWDVGSEEIQRGLQFVAMNFSVIMDEQVDAPVGFDITFPALVRLAITMGLEFPATQTNIEEIFRLRDIELKRMAGDKCLGEEAYLVYVAEGLFSQVECNTVFKFQRKNGSLFNSPAATAAALVHNYDDKGLQYLDSIVNMFGSTVPTQYPLNIYSRLSLVDTLEMVGISRHFSSEIKNILDKTYILWSQGDEEMMSDAETCAMAFRLLRMNGYDVSSEELSQFSEASSFHNSLEGYLDDTKTLLELYKASKISLSENEPILEKISCWSGSLLNEKLCSDVMRRISLSGQVEYALKFPFYAMVEPMYHKMNIEHFDTRVSQNLRTKKLRCLVNQDVLALATEDFSTSQPIYQAELQQLKSWEKESKFDKLRFIRDTLTMSYLSAAATISPYELSDARVACAKCIQLTAVADDLFDVGGSLEELRNLISLVEKWDQHHQVGFCSEHVKIVFTALYKTVNQLGAKASVVQNRDVTKYMAESWLDYLRSLLTDAERQRNKYVPTMEEYMTNAIETFALGPIIHTTLYFLGQNLWEDIVKYPEYNEMFRLMSTCGRLQNDTQTFERECEDGKLNSVSLLILQNGGSMSIEAAKTAIQESITSYRRDLLRLVLREDSVIPKACRDMFWSLYKTSHVFYSQADGFSSAKDMMVALNAVINEPLTLQR